MTNETKTPQAEQWWVNSSGKIRYIIGVKLCGSIVYEDSTGWSFANGRRDWSDWHHEPCCTGFDWTEPPAIDPGEGWELLPVGTVLQEGDEFESGGDWNKTCYPGTKNIKGWTYRRRKPPAETWPKWYRWDVDTTGFVFRRMENGAVFTHQLGFPAIQSDDWSVSLAGAFSIGGLIEISEAEAIARLKPAEPAAAESPDDWIEITDPDHVLRRGVYQVSGFNDVWSDVVLSDGRTLEDSGWSKARCRRRDLPVKLTPFPDAFAAITTAMRAAKEEQTPQPKTMDVSPGEGWRWVEKDEPWQEGDDCLICDFKHAHTHNCQCWRRRIVPQPKRTPMRLWKSPYDNRQIVWACGEDISINNWQEIKCDGSGFYVEGE